MKKVIALLTTLSLTTAVFAQEEAEESTQPSVEETATATVEEHSRPTESAAEATAAHEAEGEKKPMFHVDKRQDPLWGIRGGVHFAGISGEDLSVGWHIGGVFYPIKFFDIGFRGDLLGLKLFLEPRLFFVTKESIFKKNQYWLEMPINASFVFTVAGMRLKYAVGPNVAVGIIGDYEQNLGEGAGDLKTGRFDLGLSNTLGYEVFKNGWMELNTSSGFLNLVDGSKKSKSFAIKITCGYDF